MSAHLCDDQIRRLLGGTLPEDELAHAEDHLWQCPDCRDALRRRTEPTPAVPPFQAPPSTGAASPDCLGAVPGYEVLGELGRGGMGVVYRARQVRAGRLVALKMILSGAHANCAELSRLLSEAEAIARLQHPNIVQVFEVGEHQGVPYFSLEYCLRGSLDRVLRATPLAPREAAALVEKLARAMDATHRGVRDACPRVLNNQEQTPIRVRCIPPVRGLG
jgi:hypothetical protein